MSRKQILKNELKNIVAILKREYKPKKIILFGSFAKGKVNRWSDLDLVIVQNTTKRYIERLKEVALLTKPNNEILNKGKILYEAQ